MMWLFVRALFKAVGVWFADFNLYSGSECERKTEQKGWRCRVIISQFTAWVACKEKTTEKKTWLWIIQQKLLFHSTRVRSFLLFLAGRRRKREENFIYILFLPSLDGTTSGFFSSYISSDWLKGTEIFSLIGKLPGRCLLFDFLLLAVRIFNTTTIPIMTQTSAVSRPTRMPNESIVERSNVSCWPKMWMI